MPAGRWAASQRSFSIKTALAAVFVVLVCATIIGLGALREVELRDAELRSAEVETSNLARSLVQHADDTLEIADTALIGIAHRLETEGFTPEAVGRLQSFVNLRKATLPWLRGLFVYGADGSWLATSETANITGHNNSDRDYFRHHMTSRSREPFFGQPVRSRSSDQWVVTLSRRVNLPDGSFGGVVLTTIDAAYFARHYTTFDVGANGSIALLGSDGTLIARSPFDESHIGRDFSGSSLIRSSTGQMSGLIRFRSSLDGIDRYSAFRRSERFPFMVLVAQAHDDIVAGWRSATVWRMGSVIGLTLMLAALGFLFVRELATKHRMLRVIQSKEADFRLLAESSSDMVARISFDGVLTYVSPSAQRITGWSASELVGTKATAGLHPEDRARVDAVVAALRKGEITETTIGYRTRHRERGEIWLESALTVTFDPATGEIDGVVCVSRDMSGHKELEQRLTSMAARDGLTGLANRRAFDEALAVRHERALADRKPLSLLLIDVDHFKNFNDEYGHPAGDDCLRRIGQVLAAQASRPQDLAARYGGEEFALILPDTDRDGARIVAARICEAVKAMRIPHARSSAARSVTVSIGGATMLAGDEITTPAGMVSSADTALYAAKAAGRNTARVSALARPIGDGMSKAG